MRNKKINLEINWNKYKKKQQNLIKTKRSFSVDIFG